MVKLSFIFKAFPVLIIVIIMMALMSCFKQLSPESSQKKYISSKDSISVNEQIVERNLASFDALEKSIFTDHNWIKLNDGYAKDVITFWPDGHTSKGIDTHIAELKRIFAFAPNMRIKNHMLHFGSGNMTCVTGTITGTFSSPMPVGNGKVITPTKESFSLPICNVAIWKNGQIIRNYLYWDNESYLYQIGLTE